jgi:hypothetical protein
VSLKVVVFGPTSAISFQEPFQNRLILKVSSLSLLSVQRRSMRLELTAATVKPSGAAGFTVSLE